MVCYSYLIFLYIISLYQSNFSLDNSLGDCVYDAKDKTEYNILKDGYETKIYFSTHAESLLLTNPYLLHLLGLYLQIYLKRKLLLKIFLEKYLLACETLLGLKAKKEILNALFHY